ncbi:MAG TPA: hypothetical protein PKC48_00320 [Sphingorhabdus sp.]|jgi:hypothetical protein|uniref:hypothetical protein n=1 Tax=Sphingorhabdus sp. TaxID=1902408 RepID=UPI002BECA995|nr:hypothetical protein [Sphingorhabdus sp.]HMT41088.1 hypothetical protein [Sphingorhabdus sp.]HMU20696.1 hypothetical protein [Sphingorhabdus sp.]
MFRVNNPAYSLPVIAVLLLAGCSLPEGEFPSLAKRSYETSEPVGEPSAEPEQLTTSIPADVDASVNLLLARHQKAESAFRSALGGVRKAAQSAAGSAIGSESWASAEVELSRLDVARGDSVAALAEMDKLIADQRERGADSGLLGLLAEPQSRLAADVAAQTAEIEALARLIG